MPIKTSGVYPKNWDKIAEEVKKKNGYKCEKCKHKHEVETGYMLTVHHLDGDKSNCEEWNLAALCQRCHLKYQAGKNIMMENNQEVFKFFKKNEWYLKHINGALKKGRKT